MPVSHKENQSVRLPGLRRKIAAGRGGCSERAAECGGGRRCGGEDGRGTRDSGSGIGHAHRALATCALKYALKCVLCVGGRTWSPRQWQRCARTARAAVGTHL